MFRAALRSRSCTAPQAHIHSRSLKVNTPLRGETSVSVLRAPHSPHSLLDGEEAVNHGEVFTMPDGLVLKLTAELPKGRIQNALGKLGFRHALHAQGFNAQPRELPDQLGGRLMNEVVSLMGDAAVNAGHLTAGPGIAVAAPSAAGKRLLRLAELPFAFAKELRGRLPVAVAECHEALQPEVNTDHFGCVNGGQRYGGHRELHDQRNVPVPVRLSAEGGALGDAVDVSGLAELDEADLRYVQAIAFDPHALEDAERGCVAALALRHAVAGRGAHGKSRLRSGLKDPASPCNTGFKKIVIQTKDLQRL